MHAPLLAHAAAVEGRGLGLPSLQIGVGKAAAAATLAAALAELRPRWVLLFGVCGAYPTGHVPEAGLEVGQLCVVGEEWFADEGVATADRFVSIADLGLGSIGPFHADAARSSAAAQVLAAPLVRAATVSTCSGTDETSLAAAARTGAAIETMEGAAVAVACARAGVPWVQLRCVSNRTGERSRGGWDLPRAVAIVQEAVRTLAGRRWGEP